MAQSGSGVGGQLRYDAGRTRQLVNDYIKYKLTQKGYEWTSPSRGPPMGHQERHQQEKASRTMQLLGDDFETRYSQTFDEMCNQLDVTQSSAHPTFVGVTHELFGEGIQWGRVVALFAFAGSLAAQCMHKEMPQLVDSIAEWMAEFVDQYLAEWIGNHGGWEGFVEYYDTETHPERRSADAQWPSMRNFFCGVAAGALGVLTIGAILTSRS